MDSMTATTEPAGLPPGPLTVADLVGMPSDGHRYELLDGVLVVTPAPSPLHQRASFRLAILLDAAAPPEIEVLSPSTRLFDLNLKRAAYERMGAASYWVVDPDRLEVVVLELDDDGRYVETVRARGDEELRVDRPFPLSFRPAELVRHP